MLDTYNTNKLKNSELEKILIERSIEAAQSLLRDG